MVVDLNNNGKIDNINELFGENQTNATGFKKLATTYDSNQDKVINNKDANFSKLKVWKDADEDGYVDNGELKTLTEHNIASINLGYMPKSGTSNNGNQIVTESTYTKTDGTVRKISDVMLKVDHLLTKATGKQTIDLNTVDLPWLRGFGDIKDLLLIAAGNDTLKNKIWDVYEAASPVTAYQKMDDLLVHWAGIQSIPANQMRGSITERKALILTKFLKLSLPQNIPNHAKQGLENAYKSLKNKYFIDFIGQTSIGESLGIEYNFNQDKLVFDAATIKTKLVESTANSHLGFAAYIATRVLLDQKKFTYEQLQSAVSTAGYGSELLDFLKQKKSLLFNFNNTINGTASHDIIFGSDASNIIQGNAGNDYLSGGDGLDTLSGGAGNDTYLYNIGDKNDVINEGLDTVQGGSGTDTLLFGTGISTANIAFTRQTATSSDLIIRFTGSSENLTIKNWFISANNKIENFKFTNGNSLTLSQVNSLITVDDGSTYNSGTDPEANSTPVSVVGTSDDDNISNYGNKSYDAGAGNDLVKNYGYGTITGGTGSDVLYNYGEGSIEGGQDNDGLFNYGSSKVAGGDGDDHIQNLNESTEEFTSTATLEGGAGNDQIVNNGVAQIDAGDGSNYVENNLNANIIAGQDSDIVLNNENASSVIKTGAGNDQILNYGSAQIEAGSGFDRIENHGNALVFANNENDTIINYGTGNFYGGDGEDYISNINEASILSGDGGHDVIISSGKAYEIYGGDGNDVITYSFTPTGIETYATEIFGGSGHDEITGGNASEYLSGDEGNDAVTGNGGDDTIDGGQGIDSLQGGDGNDLYLVDDTLDQIQEFSAGGQDRVISSATYTLGNYVEDLSLSGIGNIDGTGNSIDNKITGNSGNNSLSGNAGNDTLSGGDGTDTLTGNDGDDLYIIKDMLDLVVETSNEGIDSVISTVSYALTDHVENLQLDGYENIDGTGNILNNHIKGNAANNVLNGGSGNDTLEGAQGNDTYIIDSSSDVIIENQDEGIDTVQSSLTTTLGSHLENLTLTGSGAIHGTGNTLDNHLVGNTGDNSLTGAAGQDTLDGGSGADSLLGGTGNDTYFIDNTGDSVTELSGEGTDSIISTINYTLGAYVENLTLSGSASTGSGNTLDNLIVGNSGANTLTGDAGHDTLDGGTGADSLIGGTGNDTYIVDNISDVVVESANEGLDTIQSTLSTTIINNVENLILTGSDALDGTGNTLDNHITGNSNINSLSGGSGNDTLDGGLGADTLVGGTGNDTFIVDNVNDVITELSGEGTDTVQSTINYTLGTDLENLTLIGNAAINATGNAGNNYIIGNSGDNSLDGSIGVDTLEGGDGDDIYVIDDQNDVVTENADQGHDVVKSSVTYTLSSNVENLILTGSSAINGTGNTLDNYLLGNSGDNSLSGGAGNDTLNGSEGIDTLVGGTGNDTYIIDHANDVLTENASEGTDTVISSVSHTLGTHFENLTLSGLSNTTATGNSQNNILTGNQGHNTLDGSTGADSLSGGFGNDTYIVDDAGDTVTEVSDGGTDSVQSSVTFTLGDNLENLSFTGSSDLNGTGNALNNTLTGNSGNNSLTGLAGNDSLDGGTGADTMLGGTGNDHYTMDDAGDVVTELSNEGIDSVVSSLTYTLGNNVEHLTLTGSTNIDGIGNALDSQIIGNSGNNSLAGSSGNDTLDGQIGSDTLAGGTGNDTYIIDHINDVVTESAGEGEDSILSSVTHTLANDFEHLTLTGSGNIHATGNASNNNLIGNSGANSITAGSGHDTLTGGEGNDTLQGDDGNDLYRFSSNWGVDSLIDSSGTDTVDMSQVSSNLTLNLTTSGASEITDGTNTVDWSSNSTEHATGGSGNDLVNGTTSANSLSGGVGNDTLDGKTGADTLIGGLGNDTYMLLDELDTINEQADEGIDTVLSNFSMTLGLHVERLTLQGSSNLNAYGNALDNTLNGNSGVNILQGMDGNDLLSGGAGADSVYGGTGNDTITVGSDDFVYENEDEGIDTIRTGLSSYTLGAHFENMLLVNAAVTGVGNALNNLLTGTTGNNILEGAGGGDTLDGGGGSDTLVGGTGSDTYIVDNTGVTIVEDANGHTDTVKTSIDYTLGTNIEHLTLTGTSNLTGTGNTLNNRITGNTGDNTLNGVAGDDTLIGGQGNDTYIVDSVNDVITENANAGTDTVQASVSCTLANHVENLVLTGSSAINATGNDLNNVLTGNSGNNSLDGGGGGDTLSGGHGNDVYLVDNAGGGSQN